MTEKENEQKQEKHPVDEYTGEPEPPAEDADEVVEVMPVDTEEREGESYLLEEEEAIDTVALDADADAITEKVTRYTEDETIEEEFEERQKYAAGGRDALQEELDDHHFEDPDATGGDVDAAWDDAVQAGDEAVGGTAPTPDQDVVDELGAAVGLEYEADEPLQSEEKFRKRDRDRWELDPESAEEE